MPYPCKKVFEVKEEHLKLLQNAYVSWNDLEYGAASIDPKYPYGSGFYESMANILGLSVQVKEYSEYSEEDQKYMDELHVEMQPVLEITFQTLSFEIGWYLKNESENKWKKITTEELEKVLSEPDVINIHQRLKENHYYY